MSALPVTQKPEHQPEPEDLSPPTTDSREDDENYWEWVALVVLLACWLAETYI